MTKQPLLAVNNLTVSFATGEGIVAPVRGVTFQLAENETLGIIGESGCGKSVTAESIMGLLTPAISDVQGEVLFRGKDLLSLSPKGRRAARGSEIAMIFQDPLSSLNPLMTVGGQIGESLRVHRRLGGKPLRERVIALLHQVGIVDPAACAAAYPHEISGGMRQRVMIAMAIACDPALLIADEPTTALDVTIQAQILALLDKLKADHGMGIILITHDLSVVALMCRRVLVMYLGEIVEEADVMTLFDSPLHPYTRGLMASMPTLGGQRKIPLTEIKGSVPPLTEPATGCGFAPRCPYVKTLCRRQPPPLLSVQADTDDGASANSLHGVRCWRTADMQRGMPE
ncbi:ABC transporter ATP-binding protein [Sodalis sp. dw_96]|uniref:ABC transporter ATP-binding protein n=1 Tax=Sodalis sp. dw_96 TaxID=2719794 RepID=UPI001BD264DB|nr:ABC transporter ATP-binding protein [Sodalis sp. dw_96]